MFPIECSNEKCEKSLPRNQVPVKFIFFHFLIFITCPSFLTINFLFYFQMDEHQKMKCSYEEISCPFNICDFKVCELKTNFCNW